MPKSDGYKNLITPSTDEARKRGAKGGKASGESRRKKKTMRETLSALLELSLKDGPQTSIDSVKTLKGLSGANITVQEALLIAQVQKALKGDGRAFDTIKDIIMPPAESTGQNANKTEASNSVVIEIVGRKHENES